MSLLDGPHWNARYEKGDTPWDLGAPPPVLVDLLRDRRAPPRRRVLVPGAGRGHDAIAWAAAGHEVVAVDFAPLAVAGARRLAAERGVALEIIESDVLALPPDLEARFDLVWEHTCYCALPRARRDDYVRAMARALAPDGTIVGLFWNHTRGDERAPPYDVTPDDVRERFGPLFRIDSLVPVRVSAPGRSNEFLATMRRVS